MVLNGGHNQWVMGLGVLVHPGDSGTKPGLKEQGQDVQRHEVQWHEVLPHSPRSQLGLPEKGKAHTNRDDWDDRLWDDHRCRVLL